MITNPHNARRLIGQGVVLTVGLLTGVTAALLATVLAAATG